MLNLMGRNYVIDYVISEYQDYVEEKIYKAYVTDLIKSIAESIGVEVNDRYADLIDNTPKDTRTGDEIALDVIKRAGLKVKQDGFISISSEIIT